jgi:two-component system phosphate regulon sensor histidine kinase PhoR
MTNDGESVESLRERLRHFQAELDKKNEYVARLERANKTLSAQIQEARDSGQSPAEITEIEETLRRLLTRIGMILQGSKCLFMSYDSETGELFADTPALGFEDAEVKKLRVKATEGISGEVFRENHSVILYDAETDERAQQENFAALGIKNGVCVPLAIERRDEETNRVLDRKLIGVIWVFNKKFGNIFIDEDIQLLERMARNTAAIINTAEKFREIIKERDEVIETIEALTMGLIMVNTNNRITQMNNSALKIFGLTKDDLAAGNSLDAVIKDEKIREMLTRAISSDGEVAEEVTLPDPQSPDQNHVFQVQSATVRNDAGDTIGTATIFNDITEVKNVDKMKTAFVSTVSHELRTPLTSIKGFISTLVQDTEGFYDNETRHEFYTIIDTECDRLRRLIDDLLNVSRIESGNALQMNISDVDLRGVTDKVITIQNGSTYKRPNHAILSDFDADVPRDVQADEDMVNQILANLISNALKYSPKGGEVKVSAKMMSPELVQFAVSDQGMGIPKEHLSKMFQRFHRVDNRDTREIGGTGIGLFLVKALVEQHHGRIWLDSEYGKGTTFFFTLPTHQPEEDADGGSGGGLSQRVAG